MASFGKRARSEAVTHVSSPPTGLRALFFGRRRHSRQRLLLPGKLWCGLGRPALDCLIGDASMGGARIRVKAGAVVPNDVFLIHLREWTAYKARVVWRHADGNLGLAFRKICDLRGTSVPELRAMRDYCVAFERAG